MDSIQEQSNALASRLVESTRIDGKVNPYHHLELYSLNVILSICFGKHFETIHDPEFVKLSEMILTSMKLAGIENDLPNFLPILSIFDYISGSQKATMEKFIKEQRNPIFTQLIEDAEKSDRPNVLHYLKANGFDFTLEEKIVLMCMFMRNIIEADLDN